MYEKKMFSNLELQMILNFCAYDKIELTTPREYPDSLGYKQYSEVSLPLSIACIPTYKDILLYSLCSRAE